MSESKVPGLKAEHKIITPNCRKKGDFVAFDEAVAALRYAYRTYLPLGNNSNANIHLVLTIEHPKSEGE